MVDLCYHKGQKCKYCSTFCQEGYCSECNIWLYLIKEVNKLEIYPGSANIKTEKIGRSVLAAK